MKQSALRQFGSYLRAHKVSLVLVAALSACGYFMEEHKEWFPWLVSWQSYSYTLLTWLDPTRAYPDHVVVVEIDDRTYKLKGFSQPTDRHFLATLVRRAVQADAATVVLDINLTRDNSDGASARIGANRDLLAAIKQAAARPISPLPVVLAVAFRQDAGQQFSEIPNVIADAALPRLAPRDEALVGFDNAPTDQRKLPLVFFAHSAGSAATVPFSSLSLRSADAYGEALHLRPITSERPAVRSAIDNGEFLYTTFLPTSAFQHVSAIDLANGLKPTLALLDHRIVLIGGNRHDGYGRLIDVHATPLGPMIGVYIHGNRIEALLQGRLKRTMPWWVPVVADIVLGVAIVVFASRAKTLRDRLFVLAVFTAPIVVAYFLFVNLQYALDFALPLFVLVLHVALDRFREFGPA